MRHPVKHVVFEDVRAGVDEVGEDLLRRWLFLNRVMPLVSSRPTIPKRVGLQLPKDRACPRSLGPVHVQQRSGVQGRDDVAVEASKRTADHVAAIPKGTARTKRFILGYDADVKGTSAVSKYALI